MKFKVLSAALVISSFVVAESDVQEFSIQSYCNFKALPSSIIDEQYLSAYAKRLGKRPTKQECDELKLDPETAENDVELLWDFEFNRPYSGSAIRLTEQQVNALKKFREETGSEYWVRNK